MPHWNYRVLRREVNGETELAVHEVYWDGDRITGWTETPATATAETLPELRDVLAKMATAPEFDVIEISTDDEEWNMSWGHWSGDYDPPAANRPPSGLRHALAMAWRDARPELAQALQRLALRLDPGMPYVRDTGYGMEVWANGVKLLRLGRGSVAGRQYGGEA
jgi:hypothetical protein